MARQEKAKRRNGAKYSVIVTLVMRFASFIYNGILKSVFAFLMTSYDRIAEAGRNSLCASVCKKIFAGLSVRSTKQRISGGIEKSVFLGLWKNICNTFLCAPVSVFGVFSASFGLYSTVIYIMKTVAFGYERNFADPAVGAFFLLLSVFFFASGQSVSQAFAGSRILTFAINDFLGVRGFDARPQSAEGRGATNIMFLLGMVLGLATILVRPLHIIAAIVLIAFASFVMTYPESGVLLIFLLLPFLKTKMLAAIVILIAISLFVKLIRGKRVLKFSPCDIPVAVLMLFYLLGGINSVTPAESMKRALLYICFMSMYFMVKSLLCSAKMLSRAISCCVISLGLVSLIGIAEYFIGNPILDWIDTQAFSYIRGRAVSVFENPNVLGEFLIMTIPVATAAVLSKKADGVRSRFASAMAALLGCGCLALTWSRGAWLGFVTSMVFFALFASRKMFAAMIIASPLASLLVFAKGSSILGRFTNLSDSSTSYRVNIWRGSLDMIKENLISGIGTGESAFSKIYPLHAIGGAEVAYHSHSLYLQFIVEMGIFALIAFLIFVVVLASRGFSFIRRYGNAPEKLMCIALFTGLAAFLIQGTTDFVFYNYRIFLFFWMMTGLAVSYTDFAFEKAKDEAEHYLSGI